jgi:hypothetical protein
MTAAMLVNRDVKALFEETLTNVMRNNYILQGTALQFRRQAVLNPT